jgi:hypothetical protein
MTMRLALTLTLLLSLVPVSVGAQVSITEIMYDAEGSDSGYEWIEVKNTGSQDINLTTWKFFEGETNHGITAFRGGEMLAAGSYAIVADNASQFISEWGQVKSVFDSSFSLRNDGETLSMRNAQGVDVDVVTYSADWGGAGDGNTVQHDGQSWSAAPPTPGSGYTSGGTVASEDNSVLETNSTSADVTAQDDTVLKRAVEIVADAGTDRIVMVGAAEFFEGKAYKGSGEEYPPYVEYQWNFGNGKVVTGKKVLHQYNYPGVYVVTLTATTPGGLTDTDRIVVTAEPVKMHIVEVTSGYIKVKNTSEQEIDLTMWSLGAGDQIFAFPNGTVILGSSELIFPHSVTGLSVGNLNSTRLLYPNGMPAHMYRLQGESPTHIASTDNSLFIEDRSSEPLVSQNLLENGQREMAPTTSVLAASGVATSDGELFKWLLALAAVLILAILAVLFVRRKEELDAEDFTIIDESEDE